MSGVLSDLIAEETLEGDLVMTGSDETTLGELHQYALLLQGESGTGLQFSTSQDIEQTLIDVDYIIYAVNPGQLDAVSSDYSIATRYGVTHTSGLCVGPGGIGRGLRCIPGAVALAKKIESISPEAWLINLADPMSAVCQAIEDNTQVKWMGASADLGRFMTRLFRLLLPESISEVRVQIAGIHQLSWLCGLSSNNIELLSRLKEVEQWTLDEDDKCDLANPHKAPHVDIGLIKFALLRQLGALSVSDDRCLQEFFPEFNTNPEKLIELRVQSASLSHQKRWEERSKTTIRRAIRRRTLPGPIKPSMLHLGRLIASLNGERRGRFLLSLPNNSWLDWMVDEAAVEGVAQIVEGKILRQQNPVIPGPVQDIVRTQWENQRLLCEAALRREPAIVQDVISQDPMCQNIENTAQLAEELIASNSSWM
jgi:alpha-galactosidase/6-phospho-beta-glucosidase family protein